MFGLRGRKHISDASIISISRSPQWMLVRFDGSDEIIIMKDDILDDFPPDVLDRTPIQVDEQMDERLQERVDAMRARQATLGPVSWRFGRLGGKPKTIRAVQTRQVLILAIPAALVVLSALIRKAF